MYKKLILSTTSMGLLFGIFSNNTILAKETEVTDTKVVEEVVIEDWETVYAKNNILDFEEAKEYLIEQFKYLNISNGDNITFYAKDYYIEDLVTYISEHDGISADLEYPYYYLTNEFTFNYQTIMDSDNNVDYYKIELAITYYDSDEEREKNDIIINDIVDKIVKDNDLKTEFDVLYAVNEYIVKNYSYNLEPKNDKSPYSLYDFLTNKEGVCQVYAMLGYELLTKLGIETKMITGYITENKEEHLWLGVKINGEWFNFDPTWNDPIWLDGTPTLALGNVQYLLFKNSDYQDTERVYRTNFVSTTKDYKETKDVPYNYTEISNVELNKELNYLSNLEIFTEMGNYLFISGENMLDRFEGAKLTINKFNQVFVEYQGKKKYIKSLSNNFKFTEELTIDLDKNTYEFISNK